MAKCPPFSLRHRVLDPGRALSSSTTLWAVRPACAFKSIGWRLQGSWRSRPICFYRDGRWRCLFRSILDPSHPVPDLDIARAWRDWVGLFVRGSGSCFRFRRASVHFRVGRATIILRACHGEYRQRSDHQRQQHFSSRSLHSDIRWRPEQLHRRAPHPNGRRALALAERRSTSAPRRWAVSRPPSSRLQHWSLL